MKPRTDLTKHLAAGPGKALLAFSNAVDQTGIGKRLYELVKIRASQINGCAYCLDMHTKDARVLGETERRIYALNAWRETPFYSDKEHAALEWPEALTRVRGRRTRPSSRGNRSLLPIAVER